MISRTSRTLGGALFTLTFLLAATLAQSSFAQDNSAGRYRPEGRQIGFAAAREFDERLFEVRTYDPSVNVVEFAAATIFYPLTLSFDAPNGAIAFAPGYRASKDNYEWWGPALASLGYVVMILDTNAPDSSLDDRKQALIAAVEFLKNENNNSDSPLNNKIDSAKIAIMGHSMGAGGALEAAVELGDSIKAVIPLTPYCCEPGQPYAGDLSALTVPTLIIASAEDTVAPPADHARMLYDAIPASTTKVYMEFATGSHNLPANGGPDLQTLGMASLAFLKVHLDGRENLASYIDDDMDADMAAKFSSYLTNP
jgi:predicted esterase